MDRTTDRALTDRIERARRMLAAGYKVKEIAKAVHISSATIVELRKHLPGRQRATKRCNECGGMLTKLPCKLCQTRAYLEVA